MQSPSLKANQQTEKLESVLPQFIPVSEIQRESKYIVYKSISHLTGNFSTCDKLPKSLTHSCTQISMWGWKSETERIFYPCYRDPCTIRELIYGTYLFETLRISHPRSLFLLFLGWSSVHLAWSAWVWRQGLYIVVSSPTQQNKKKVTLGMNRVMSSGLPNIKNCLTTRVEPWIFYLRVQHFIQQTQLSSFFHYNLYKQKVFNIRKIEIFKFD